VYLQDSQGTCRFLLHANPRKEKKNMSKMAEMDMTIKELREAAAAISSAADWLSNQFSEDQETPDPEPTQKKALALEDIRPILADKSRAGFTDQIRDLLHKYGTDRLSKVDPKDYEALLKDVEALS
jgi:aldehyde:ferredoxin oxidoreductase